MKTCNNCPLRRQGCSIFRANVPPKLRSLASYFSCNLHPGKEQQHGDAKAS